MGSISASDLRPAVYNIVSQIPEGRVLTYGEIARLAGFPNHSRLVGRVMRDAPDAQLPCHRVVASDGRMAPHYAGQRPLLEAEGVAFTPRGKVNMRRFLWHP